MIRIRTNARAKTRTTISHPGFVVVDKPAGWTSHDVVGKLRRLAKTRRVGHAGTLDPMATGVLVLGVERATKLLGYIAGDEKSYDATIRLGESTVTDDAEGAKTASADASGVDDAAVTAALQAFRGEFSQVPSSVSAVKVGGQRSYARVRSGEAVELAARQVRVSQLDLLVVRPGEKVVDLDVSLTCSSGTYVRAIARDLGATLGVGGHLTALRRTRVGGFDISAARTLEALAELDDPVTISLETAVAQAFGRRDITADQARAVSHGGRLTPIDRPRYGVFDPDGTVIAVMEESDGAARPLVVLRPA